jgi:hypothetical protein
LAALMTSSSKNARHDLQKRINHVSAKLNERYDLVEI